MGILGKQDSPSKALLHHLQVAISPIKHVSHTKTPAVFFLLSGKEVHSFESLIMLRPRQAHKGSHDPSENLGPSYF